MIIQGPPGTGKTRLAKSILEQEFRGRGLPVQFHPAVTYETFVAGISPDVQYSQLRFQISPGWLVRAVREASQKDFLLFIDEINRADLSRVLGEAIYLLEAREINQGQSREIELPQPLPDGTTRLHIPKGLFILGTMNSADRSIAILDLAVRRRFAFVDLWPDLAVLEQSSRPFATEAFGQLQDIFAQHAPRLLVLLPGHAYFLADSDEELDHRLRFELIPLLNEYLQEGRLGPCESEPARILIRLEGELTRHG